MMEFLYYIQPTRPGMIEEGTTPQESELVMANDPAVRGGVMRARLHPYRVALMEGRD